MRAIVIYASHEGQTERIAVRIQQRLAEHSIPCDRYDVVKQSADEIQLGAYDAVVIGSPLHYDHHDPRIRFCIEHNRGLLNDLPTAFFSISLAIASVNEKDRDQAKWLAGEFLRSTSWQPPVMECFAGVLKYSKYNWWKRHVMQRIAQQSGAETSFDHDDEYTDWERVDAFADRFDALVRACKRPPVHHPRFSGLH